jgi:uncharacterized protein (TIGR02246 family)
VGASRLASGSTGQSAPLSAIASERSDVEVNESEIAGELAAGFARAWNSHDMEKLARLFHEDAAFVNVRGMYLRGQEEIRQHHAAVHAGPFKEAALRAEVVDARQLAPGVIVAHMRSELDGDDRVPGQTRRSMVTLIIERRAGLWRFAAVHNTDIVPPAT